jgi:hypothetical protein
LNNKLKKILAILHNPVTDKLNIRVSSDITATSYFKVINNLGQIIYSQNNKMVKGDNLVIISSHGNLLKGIYTLQMVIYNQLLTARVLKS